MKFWDTSALVPLFVNEARSFEVRRLIASDPNVAVAFLTPVELRAAASRRFLTRNTTTGDSHVFLAALENAWTVIHDDELILVEANDFIWKYRLRAADAIQLAAAKVASKDAPKLPFVTLDEELLYAAAREGFPTLP